MLYFHRIAVSEWNKMEKYKLNKKYLRFYIKMEKAIITFGDTEIQKQISPTKKPYFNKKDRH